MDDSLLDNFDQGPIKLGAALRGLTHEQLSYVPTDEKLGKWTIAHVVIHLADAESAFADRIKRIIAEDDPTLLAWDENRFSERLHYPDQSAEDAAAIIALTRRQLSRVLRKLPEAAFSRSGQHSQRGRQTLTDVLKFDVWHLEHHLNFIHLKRNALGIPLGD